MHYFMESILYFYTKVNLQTFQFLWIPENNQLSLGLNIFRYFVCFFSSCFVFREWKTGGKLERRGKSYKYKFGFWNPWKMVSFVKSPVGKWECLVGELGVLNSAVSGSGAVIVSQVVKTWNYAVNLRRERSRFPDERRIWNWKTHSRDFCATVFVVLKQFHIFHQC